MRVVGNTQALTRRQIDDQEKQARRERQMARARERSAGA
jgi:hypothetical protein